MWVTLTVEPVAHAPREWAERTYTQHRWTELPRGGHFANFEEPELMAEEIRAFFRPLRGPLYIACRTDAEGKAESRSFVRRLGHRGEGGDHWTREVGLRLAREAVARYVPGRGHRGHGS